MLKPANQVRIHIELSRLMLKNKSGVTIRAYAAWTALRTMDQPHFDRDEVIEFLIERTGRTRQTVQSWIKSGIKAGFFLAGRKSRISLVGKLAIFAKFLPNSKPGAVVLVSVDDLLTGKLQTVRARLYGSQFAKKPVWASRETLKEISGPTKATQIKYDRINRQRKQFHFLVNRVDPQIPNTYFRSQFFFTLPQSNKAEKFGLHGSFQKTPEPANRSPVERFSEEPSLSEQFSLAEKRVFFDRSENAKKASRRRFARGLPHETFSTIEPERVTRTARRRNYGFVLMHVGYGE